MKKLHFTLKTFVLVTLGALFMGACQKNAAPADGISIKGTITNFDGDSLYLYDVFNEHYGYIVPVATIEAKDGKFVYTNDSILSKVYYISPKEQQSASISDDLGAFFFLSRGENKLSLNATESGALEGKVLDSAIDEKYQAFKEKEYTLGNQAALDSLYAAFYVARDAGDTLQMAEINKAIEPIYDEGVGRKGAWLDSLLKANNHELFDLYLHYNRVFSLTSYDSVDAINSAREDLGLYSEEAQASGYAVLITQSLDKLELSAIGKVAPDVSGESPEGETINLSDFRGKYVLMDFWSSGCSWCRAETPNLVKTFEAFKDKDFTILGISTDFDKSAWMKAIEEDGAAWNHLILDKQGNKKTLAEYSIAGIPQIILLDKEGNILAKGLRGEEIYETVAKHLAE